MKNFVWLAFLTLTACGISPEDAASGRIARGTVTGTVALEDSSDALSGVTISFAFEGKTEVSTAPKADGSFSAEVKEGTYSVTLTASGYKTATVSNLVVSAGAQTLDGVTLKLLGLSEARTGARAIATANKALFAGGQNDEGSSDTLDIFDYGTKSWSSMKLSAPRVEIAGAVAGSKALFAGGYGGSASSAVDVYDTTTEKLISATLGVARTSLGGAGTGDIAVFAGGVAQVSGSPVLSDAVDIFDATSDTWSTTNLSEARMYPAVAAAGDKILIAGGQNDISDLSAVSDRVDILDTSTMSWTTSSLSQARSHVQAVSVGSRAVFVGGDTPTANSNRIDVWESGSWSQLTMPQARLSGFTAASVGEKLVITGYPAGADDGAVDVYDFATSSWTTITRTLHISGSALVGLGDYVIAGGGYGYPSGHGTYYDAVEFLDLTAGTTSRKPTW